MEQIDQIDDFYTAELIAWKLYQDDDYTPLTSQVLGFGPSGETDEKTYIFEMLLSIFLEMLIHMMKMDHLKSMEECLDDLEQDFEPDFENFDMELYYPIIRNKFKKISYLVSVEIYDTNEDKDYLFEVVKDRYSRVILRQNPSDTHYFEEIGSDDNYDFIPSIGYTPKTNLKDVFAILTIGQKMHKIKFDAVQKIGAEIIKF